MTELDPSAIRVYDAGGLRAMRAVYTYCWPELRSHAQDPLPETAFRHTTPAEALGQAIEPRLAAALEIPASPEGTVDLDALSGPVTDRLVDAFVPHATGLAEFAWRYPTQGSSPGIFHLLADLAARGVTEIHVLDGEYEGYAAYASHLNIRCVTHRDTDLMTPPSGDGWWFVSDPSAVDGEPLPQDWVHRLGNAGWHIVADLAYLGAGHRRTFDVSHPNVAAVVLSLSKPWGLFRFRVGVTLTRDELPSLYATRWFYDPARSISGLAAVEAHPPFELAERYRPYQHAAIAALRDAGIPAKPSDVVLLAVVDPDDVDDAAVAALLAPFRRGDRFRLCLTPYFEDLEDAGAKV